MEVVRKDSVHSLSSDNEESVQSDSDRTSTAVEGKVLFKEVNLPQAVGTCVVASFSKSTLSTKHLYQQCLLTRNSFVSACRLRQRCFTDLHKQTPSHKRRIIKEWHGFTLPQVSSSNYTLHCTSEYLRVNTCCSATGGSNVASEASTALTIQELEQAELDC